MFIIPLSYLAVPPSPPFRKSFYHLNTVRSSQNDMAQSCYSSSKFHINMYACIEKYVISQSMAETMTIKHDQLLLAMQ